MRSSLYLGYLMWVAVVMINFIWDKPIPLSTMWSSIVLMLFGIAGELIKLNDKGEEND